MTILGAFAFPSSFLGAFGDAKHLGTDSLGDSGVDEGGVRRPLGSSLLTSTILGVSFALEIDNVDKGCGAWLVLLLGVATLRVC